ncbi:MAG: DUF1080 domain-containing protein [Rhodospirillales bacterium]
MGTLESNKRLKLMTMKVRRIERSIPGLVLLATCCAVAIVPPARAQHKLIYKPDGTFGYRDTAVQPWSGYRVHDPDRPAPKKVVPGDFSTQDRPGRPPSDAIVLFDGKDLSKWKPNTWKVENGYVEAGAGQLETIDEFGSYQLHLEWRVPNPPQGDIMDRGNNGVLLMGAFEIQIFDPTTKIYPDGQAAAVYGQTPPLVTASRSPGEWETYDIVFLAPKFKGDKLEEPARVTVLHNGVLVHHNQEIYGPTTHARLPMAYRPGVTRAPLTLAGHNNPVRFRNIWIRPL